jgi:hypothetical protein
MSDCKCNRWYCNLEGKQMTLKKLLVGAAIASGIAACGGGDTATNALGQVNSVACTSSNSGLSLPPNVVLRLFSTIYALETGTIDELGAFIVIGSTFFELASDNRAYIDGANVPLDSACYQASSGKLLLQMGPASALEILPNRIVTGKINGKSVRSKPN